MKSWLFLVLFSVIVSGCTNIGKPSADRRRAAYASVPASLMERKKQLTYSTYTLFCGKCEIPKSAFICTGRSWKLDASVLSQVSARGLAFAIDHRGYLLTAKHCVGAYMYLVGMSRGSPKFYQARLIESGSSAFGAEYAILRVSEELDEILLPSLQVAMNSRVAAVVHDSDGDGLIKLMGGTVIGAQDISNGNGLSLVTTTLPIWKGDSGGPLLDSEGRVVGIMTALQLKWSLPGMTFRCIASKPDFGHISRIIESDYKR